MGPVRHDDRLLGSRDGELAVGVPSVCRLHRSDGVARSKGSNESKKLEDAELESEQQQKLGRHATDGSPLWARARGVRRGIYQNSLLLVMSSIFFMSWLAQSLNNWRTFNHEQREHDEGTVSWGRYLVDPDFWEKTLQNWQSEFLAVGVMVVFTIYPRQRGRPSQSP